MNEPHEHQNNKNAVEISRDNSEKLNEIIRLLNGGGPDVPGLIQRVAVIERVLFGKENSGGLVATVAQMARWRAWLLSTLSAGVGGVLVALAEYILHPHKP